MQCAFLRIRHSSAVAVFGAVAMVCSFGLACGDDDEPSKPSKDAGAEKDAESGKPMTIPRGGRSGSGGAGGTGGAAVNSDAYTCVPKRGDTGGPTESGAMCCGGMGTCEGATGTTKGFPHDTCKAQPDLRCVPQPPAADEDAGMSTGFPSCRVAFPGSPANAPTYEGRCMANCFVKSSPIAARLSQATCAEGESCAPCYNPLNGQSTGVCEQPGDSPLEPPPAAFKDCGEGNTGYCIPSYAAGNAAGQLGQLTCATGELCAPKNKVADPDACFERCDTMIGLGPGACAPSFLSAGLGSLLQMSTCKTGELCIPCNALNINTGVCD
jgi:hypothetical protein